MKPGWYFNKKISILLHVGAWIIFFSLPLLLHPPFDNHRFPESEFYPPRFNLEHTVSDLLLVGIFYLNAAILLPYLINQRKTGRYLLLQLLTLAGFLLIKYLLFRWPAGSRTGLIHHPAMQGAEPFLPYHGFQRPPVYPSVYFFISREIFPFFLILLSSTAYRMIIDRIKADRIAKEKENENLKTELLFLRSQISPHFVFNVLNNMVSLANKQPRQLRSSLIRLSTLMRYMLYEVKEDKVPLWKEIEYLQNYIDIQEQRFGETVKMKVDLQPVDESYTIEPMLLIPFVENAFKHGTLLIEEAEIDIGLNMTGDLLNFSVNNKFNNMPEAVKDRTHGIGLANVKKRLSLLYGDNHHLRITQAGSWFNITLQLNLH